eukprot:Nitzschia sp. Nitz4//scaffold173_size47512//39053//44677//NITZ4_007167-RA/size47512-processed-gene-0.41-mRNA-1//-1//CDS//3329538829//9328//frame0
MQLPTHRQNESTPTQELLKQANVEVQEDKYVEKYIVQPESVTSNNNDKEERLGIADEESKRVVVLRTLVLLVLVAVASAVSALVYVLYTDSQYDTFEATFYSAATKMTQQFIEGAARRVSAVQGLSLQFTSHAIATNSTWPNVILPDFERRVANVRQQSDVISLMIFPFVTKEKRTSWEEFSVANQGWLLEGLDVQGIPEEDWDFEDIAAMEATFGPSPEGLRIPDKIFKRGPLPETGDGPYAPVWQVAPAFPSSSVINFNAFSHPSRTNELYTILNHQHSLVSAAWDYADESNPLTFGKRNAIHLFLLHGGYSEKYEWGPASDLYMPVFDSFDDNATVVGALGAFIFWQVYLEDVLSDDEATVLVVLENTCNQTFSYKVDGVKAQYVGSGDLHMRHYDNMFLESQYGMLLQYNGNAEDSLPEDHCLYRIRVYPTLEMEDDHMTNEPRRFTMILAGAMLFSCAMFILYDYLVERRQRIVLTSALKSGAVVASLFPKEVRDRLYEEQIGKADDGTKKKAQFLAEESESSNKVGLEELEEEECMAIADLYPNCSVCFMDIVGFTRWSSKREPWEVFKLLETLYKTFDKIAKRLDVFKVETIGDCYVAVTGLPHAQPNHATLMARFVAGCLMNTGLVVHRLVPHLGEDTASLTIRCGIHSGPVTAGVLRGTKSRFQLFGDTVNTAARMETLEKLCRGLNLQGRILVGCNEHQSEGINGTLSGDPLSTLAFTYAMTKNASEAQKSPHMEVVSSFWNDCENFYKKASCDPLIMTDTEFKWSTSTLTQLFPDLNIKIVKELIGTGGVLAPIRLDEVHEGYLTPSEWHERIAQMQEKDTDDTVLIDCRNTKEWQIGRFPGAPDPETTTFNQFPTWVEQHSHKLANKKVLMYCTGGIRCEKASAFIRHQIPSVQEVRHLKGGIHKYLDQFGDSEKCLWKGKNFVFDSRGAHGAAKDNVGDGADKAASSGMVGSCIYCDAPHDVFEPGCICTVCREPTLVCPKCSESLREFHCLTHKHLRSCYFTDLSPFPMPVLQQQLEELDLIISEIAVGRKFKQKRKTLTKQMEKIQEQMERMANDPENSRQGKGLKCRSCGELDCTGGCWGFHGLKRKRMLDGHHSEGQKESGVHNHSNKGVKKSLTNNAHQQEKKKAEKQRVVDELKQLNLWSKPCVGRNEETGIRVPEVCCRVLTTNTKGKWCGRTVLSMLQTEFSELADEAYLSKVLEKGLLRVNGEAVLSLEAAECLKLKNMDEISRIVHWHEPPIKLPAATIGVEQVQLPDVVRHEFQLDGSASLYVCNKPSTVPVHPAGPYLANTLTMMVEAQEGLTPKSLIPCHRIDRATSGLTMCCTDTKVARLIQSRIDQGHVQKLYIAKVHGQFPSSSQLAQKVFPGTTDIAKWQWSENGSSVQVNAPIETVDPANGIRKITPQGKAAESFFQAISFDDASSTSLIVCAPATGRSHQLRVHLQWLGFPIVNDSQYGGSVENQEQVSQETVQENASLHPPTISDVDVNAAKDICTFCSQGAKAAFSPAQLLQGGHEICLHAFRYKVHIHAKGQVASEDVHTLAELDLKVDLPPWASMAKELENVQFLKGPKA